MLAMGPLRPIKVHGLTGLPSTGALRFNETLAPPRSQSLIRFSTAKVRHAHCPQARNLSAAGPDRRFGRLPARALVAAQRSGHRVERRFGADRLHRRRFDARGPSGRVAGGKGWRPLRHDDPDPRRRAGGSGDPGDHDEQRSLGDIGARHDLLGSDARHQRHPRSGGVDGRAQARRTVLQR
ncbi:hypothetical protein D3C72_1367870 [compost metagenome]